MRAPRTLHAIVVIAALFAFGEKAVANECGLLDCVVQQTTSTVAGVTESVAEPVVETVATTTEAATTTSNAAVSTVGETTVVVETVVVGDAPAADPASPPADEPVQTTAPVDDLVGGVTETVETVTETAAGVAEPLVETEDRDGRARGVPDGRVPRRSERRSNGGP